MNDNDSDGSEAEGGRQPGRPVLGTLSLVGWLAEQPGDFQRRLAAIGRWVTVEGGKRLYSAGDEADALYGLEDGLIDVIIPISGGEECTIHRAKAGFWVGDGAIRPGVGRTLSVETVTKCRLFRVPLSVLRRHLSDTPGDWSAMHRLATLNGTLAVRILSEVLSLPPRARIARLLVRMSDETGTVQATHEELGRLAGMSRATFRRSLSNLVSTGAVETRYGSVRIVDRAAVEREANGQED